MYGIFSIFSNEKKSVEFIHNMYQEYYRDEQFVFISDQPPTTKQTLGNNRCIIYPTIDTRTNRLIVIACIDNLVKGASGQAIQCMNLMFGLKEETGLEALPLYPA